MPIYEYHCKNCNKEFELLVRNSIKPECPKCGNRKLSKKMSAFAVGSSPQNETSELCGNCGRTPGSCALE